MKIHTLDLNFADSPDTIACYLLVSDESPILIDPGPGSTLEALKARLAEHGFTPADVRHVLVTHIHLDHAGSSGWWAGQNAQVHVHHFGAPHVVDPSRLLQSAQRIYGDQMDVLWGKILPAPAERVRGLHDGDVIQTGDLTITALDTPGHARHHIVYQMNDVAFTGDAAGVRLPRSTYISMPAVPPEFDREAWQSTIARLLDQDMDVLYPTHFGPISNTRAHLEAASLLIDQLAEFARVRMEAGVERAALIDQFLVWNQERARSHGLSESDLARYELANPSFMSVDGLMRYWRKRWER